MIRNDDYFEIIKEQNKELAKFRPFKSAYEMKKEIERLNNIIKEVRELVEQYSWNTYYYQCSSSRKYFKSEIISDLKQILDKENK